MNTKRFSAGFVACALSPHFPFNWLSTQCRPNACAYVIACESLLHALIDCCQTAKHSPTARNDAIHEIASNWSFSVRMRINYLFPAEDYCKWSANEKISSFHRSSANRNGLAKRLRSHSSNRKWNFVSLFASNTLISHTLSAWCPFNGDVAVYARRTIFPGRGALSFEKRKVQSANAAASGIENNGPKERKVRVNQNAKKRFYYRAMMP